METLLVSLVSLALIIVSAVTMTISTFQSSNNLAASWKQMAEQSSNINRTDISVLPPSSYSGGVIDIMLINSGQTNLSDFPKWDFIVQYQDGTVTYVNYSAGNPPGDNQWAVQGIYLSQGVPEVFDPDILDPGELMVVSIVLNPEVQTGQTCRITVSTPNGVMSQTQVTRQ